MPVNKQCSRECIDYIKSYREVTCARNIACCELADAKHEFNDTRIAMLEEKIARFDSQLSDIENAADNYTPLDVKPYRGNTFWLERAFLRCRYIIGASIEHTAELMQTSISTVRRIGKYMLGE